MRRVRQHGDGWLLLDVPNPLHRPRKGGVGMKNYADAVTHVEDLMRRKGVEEWAGVMHQLGFAHVFTMDRGVTDLLLETRPSGAPLALPFDSCFIDTDVDITGKDGNAYRVLGILVFQWVRHKETGLDFLPSGQFTNLPAAMEAQHAYFARCRRNDTGPDVWVPIMTLGARLHDDPDVADLFALNNTGLPDKTFAQIHHAIRNVIRCWLDLMHDPLVRVIRTGQGKNADKRIKREYGIKPPQSNNRIVLTGELKVYVDSHDTEPTGHAKSRHWVRGHFRHLTAERWKEARGRRVWVPPHVRGTGGILVRKEYEVEPTTLPVEEAPA
jgi:hypothetical protein